MKNIVLIGMRGCGKTVLGKILQKRTGLWRADTDAFIWKKTGKNVTELVEERGWEAFRDLETEVCRELADKKGIIISTGGGVVLREENVRLLKRNGFFLLLEAPAAILAERISRNDNSHRPSLTGKSLSEEIDEVWEQRKELYRQVSDASFLFNGTTRHELNRDAGTIERILKGKGLIP